MIPKKLHYIWWGRPLPDIEQTWMDNSIRNNPEYEYKIWTNLDVPDCKFLEVAIKEEKYAYAADYIRFWVLYNHGGFYLDTDVELIKSIEESFTKPKLVIAKETEYNLGGHFIGSSKKNPFFRQILNLYRDFNDDTIDTDKWVIPNILNKYITKFYGDFSMKSSKDGSFLSKNKLVLFPEKKIFTPYYPWDKDRTGSNVDTTNSIGIHYWNTFKLENNLILESFDGKD